MATYTIKVPLRLSKTQGEMDIYKQLTALPLRVGDTVDIVDPLGARRALCVRQFGELSEERTEWSRQPVEQISKQIALAAGWMTLAQWMGREA